MPAAQHTKRGYGRKGEVAVRSTVARSTHRQDVAKRVETGLCDVKVAATAGGGVQRRVGVLDMEVVHAPHHKLLSTPSEC